MQRLATGFLLALGLVACLFLLPPVAWLVVVSVVALLCAFELGNMLKSTAPASPAVVLPLTVVFAISTLLYGPELAGEGLTALLGMVVVVFPAILLLFTGSPEKTWPAVPWVSFGALYCAVPAVATFRLLDDYGPWLLLLLLGIVGVGDTAAYYCGKNFGKTKLAPSLSPKKTWAGSVGGVSAAVLVAAIWSWFRLERVDFVLLGLSGMTQVVGQFGDLLESAMKRTSGVKDSGTLLPGHGGVLDRADATLLASPVFVLGVQLFGAGWG